MSPLRKSLFLLSVSGVSLVSINPATAEVAELLNRAPGVTETAVYGVRVAQADGRAGMARSPRESMSGSR